MDETAEALAALFIAFEELARGLDERGAFPLEELIARLRTVLSEMPSQAATAREVMAVMILTLEGKPEDRRRETGVGFLRLLHRGSASPRDGGRERDPER